MDNDRISNWVRGSALGLVGLLLFGITYDAYVSARGQAAHRATPAWGILQRIHVGESSESAKKLIPQTGTACYTALPAINQLTMAAKWDSGRHSVQLVFIDRKLVSAYEVRFVRDKKGAILRLKWQAIRLSDPSIEEGAI